MKLMIRSILRGEMTWRRRIIWDRFSLNNLSELDRAVNESINNYYEGGIYEETSETRRRISEIVMYIFLIFLEQCKFLWSV